MDVAGIGNVYPKFIPQTSSNFFINLEKLLGSICSNA